MTCVGIYRELAHSPGRETDDAAILELTAARLRREDFEVLLLTPEEAAGCSRPEAAFVMCETSPILEQLERWEAEGTIVVNPSEGISNTYRHRTLERFEEDRVAFPPSVLLPTDVDPESFPHFSEACWVKRGDVHATTEGDVSFAAGKTSLAETLGRLRSRGVAQALVQRHVPGDLVKFYGVASAEPWFEWFYHRGQAVAKHPFRAADLSGAALAAARSLRLEVFGGDAIVTAEGAIFVIDLNAWPSFALYRDAAAGRIAAHLAARFRKEKPVSR